MMIFKSFSTLKLKKIQMFLANTSCFQMIKSWFYSCFTQIQGFKHSKAVLYPAL